MEYIDSNDSSSGENMWMQYRRGKAVWVSYQLDNSHPSKEFRQEIGNVLGGERKRYLGVTVIVD